MVSRTRYVLEDDLTQEPADETVRFGLDGRLDLEIDLTAAHASALREIFAPFIAAGRPLKASRGDSPAGPSSDDSSAIRAWAKANGHPVSDRGRISREVRQAYAARAHN